MFIEIIVGGIKHKKESDFLNNIDDKIEERFYKMISILNPFSIISRRIERCVRFIYHYIKEFIKKKYQEKCDDALYPWRIILGTKDLRICEDNSANRNKTVQDYLKNELLEVEKSFDGCSINDTIYHDKEFYSHHSYDVHKNKYKDTPDDEIEGYTSLIVEDNVKTYLRLLNVQNLYKASDFVVIDYNANNHVLNIYVAQNPRGFKNISKYKKEEKKNYINSDFKKSYQDIEQKGSSRNGISMHWGYRLEEYYRGFEIGIYLPLHSHCHALITGASGSGKSTMLLGSLANAMRSEPMQIYINDFKNSEDFHFLTDYPLFKSGEDCLENLRKFYNSFLEARRLGKKNIRRLLIFDEYSAFLNYLSAQDRINKTKLALETQSMISEILAMGRSLGYGLWICMQRPDASVLANGSRDNFMVSIALGNLSKEHKQMIFAGYDLPAERIYHAGEGILLASGYEAQEVKYAMVVLEDISEWKYHIHRLLMEDYLE